MLVLTDKWLAQEVPGHAYDGLTCPKKLDLVTMQGNLTGDQYIRDVLQPVVVPHFDNHTLATRPVYMDNARPHRSRPVTAYLQSEAVTSVFLGHVRPSYACPGTSCASHWDSWLDVPWGICYIFVSPNPHPAVGYMKQKPALVRPTDLAPCPYIPTTSC
jgi:hypothetical protein